MNLNPYNSACEKKLSTATPVFIFPNVLMPIPIPDNFSWQFPIFSLPFSIKNNIKQTVLKKEKFQVSPKSTTVRQIKISGTLEVVYSFRSHELVRRYTRAG